MIDYNGSIQACDWHRQRQQLMLPSVYVYDYQCIYCHLPSSVPSGTIKKETVNVDAINRRPIAGLVEGKNFEFEIEFVDRNRVLSRVVLSRSSQKSLSEEETGYPKHIWFAKVEPVLKKEGNVKFVTWKPLNLILCATINHASTLNCPTSIRRRRKYI